MLKLAPQGGRYYSHLARICQRILPKVQTQTKPAKQQQLKEQQQHYYATLVGVFKFKRICIKI